VISLPSAAAPLLSIDGLRVERGRTPILRGLCAELDRGRITALVGLNGSGKSTLLRTLLGEFPYRGKLHYRCGHDHRRPKPEYVGYVPQKLSLDPRLPLTVRDLLGLALARRPLFLGLGKKLNNRIAEALARVGVADLIDLPVDGLSGGQLQRVLLALALDPNPELLLLDEPAAGIDFKTQHAFYELIADINRTTTVTILLVSHDLQVVRRFAGHVLCLRDGVVHVQGPPAEVLTEDVLADTFGAEMRAPGRRHG
jgi:zinc transport system ATP-binding protein